MKTKIILTEICFAVVFAGFALSLLFCGFALSDYMLFRFPEFLRNGMAFGGLSVVLLIVSFFLKGAEGHITFQE